MPVYVVATVTIHDRAGYDRYAMGFLPTLKCTGGRLLASDESPEVLEGQFTASKVNLIEFPDREAFQRWYTSDAYQAIMGQRLEASHADIVLLRGFELPR
ncbi:MAG TPA: DUF1330 domain-containing protein [Egibacteraceae bacterium]|nr:DUF1330 domain-containing protein [Egibacteraceae bacterium]